MADSGLFIVQEPHEDLDKLLVLQFVNDIVQRDALELPAATESFPGAGVFAEHLPHGAREHEEEKTPSLALRQ